MQVISEEYRKLNEQLHSENKNYGINGQKWTSHIIDLFMAMQTRDILDYGCGKSTLANNLPFKIQQYDPCVPKYSAKPKPADIVVCTDVLEHIEPECLEEVLDDLRRVTKRIGFFVIANSKAHKTLPDGRNAHLIQEHISWWMPKLFERFDVIRYELAESKKNDEHISGEEYIIFVRACSNPRHLNLKGVKNEI